MNLSIKELNELIYSLGITANNGMLCDKQLNTSLLDKLYSELNRQIENEDTINERREDDKYEKTFEYFRLPFEDECECQLSPEVKRAVEEYIDNLPDSRSEKFNGVSQFILDFVEANGVVSYSQMNDAYKSYTNGSNSFSHILKALEIPYKNRKTRRYIKQIARGAYKVEYATQYNWVVNDVYDYND